MQHSMAEDIKPDLTSLSLIDVKPQVHQLPTPHSSPSSPPRRRVFLPPPRASDQPTATPQQMHHHITYALACGRAAQLAALKRAMVQSALKAREEREREVVRGTDVGGVKEEEEERRSAPSRLRERRRTLTLTVTSTETEVESEETIAGGGGRVTPYMVRDSKAKLTLQQLATPLQSRPSNLKRSRPTRTPRRLSLPLGGAHTKPSLQPLAHPTSTFLRPAERRRAAFTLDLTCRLEAIAVGGLMAMARGSVAELKKEDEEEEREDREGMRLCGRRGKSVLPLRLV